MKQEISDYYKEQGYICVYVNINKEPRRVATLRHKDKHMTSMSYAKYIFTSFYKMQVDKKYYDIDHINGNKLDDRIENLQLISKRLNRSKNHIRKEMIILRCPVCKKEFLFPKRNLSTHQNPCCCRKCGGIKSHWTKKKV